MKNFIRSFRPYHFVVALYAVLALAASTQLYILRAKTTPGETTLISTYNNYLIFKYSHFHLVEGKNLYTEYPCEHRDLYKYSPTFALLIGCLAWLPDWLGLSLWNLMNVLVFLVAIHLLPGLDERKKMWVLLLATADTMTSLQNSQSNLLMAGLIILGFALLERKRYLLATLCLAATFYIKIFGVAALILLLFYPGKRKNILYALSWMVILWIIPALIIGFRPLLLSYTQYLDMLKNDQSVSLGLSVMGWLKSWFSLDVPKLSLAIAGFIVICLPLFRSGKFRDYSNRILFLSALMIWMIIFNHKAESPTFIIATAGVFTWFFSRKVILIHLVLLCLVVLFTSLSATDLFPSAIRSDFFEPYMIKVVPCIMVWLYMVRELFCNESKRYE
jgi:hypothetical protein